MDKRRFLPYSLPRMRIGWPARLEAEKKFSCAVRKKLNALCNAQLKNASPDSSKRQRRTSRKNIKNLTVELNYLLKFTGLQVAEPPVQEAPREEKLMVRLDFDGFLTHPKTEELSPLYQETCRRSQQALQFSNYLFPLRHPSPSSYNLDAVPIWQTMKQFENFSAIAPALRRELSSLSFPPQRLSELNYYDISHLMLNATRKERKLLFPPRKSDNVKMFIACYEPEFVRVMRLLKHSDAEIARHIELMKNGRLDEMLDCHHKNNVCHCRNFKNISDTNAFPNMLITYINPFHLSLHKPLSLKVDASIAFMAGYDPLLQIRRDPERERRYLENLQKQRTSAPSPRTAIPLSFRISRSSGNF